MIFLLIGILETILGQIVMVVKLFYGNFPIFLSFHYSFSFYIFYSLQINIFIDLREIP